MNRAVLRNGDIRVAGNKVGQNSVTQPTHAWRCAVASLSQENPEPRNGAAPENQQSVKFGEPPSSSRRTGSQDSKTHALKSAATESPTAVPPNETSFSEKPQQSKAAIAGRGDSMRESRVYH
jgi:hypothetical protein